LYHFFLKVRYRVSPEIREKRRQIHAAVRRSLASAGHGLQQQQLVEENEQEVGGAFLQMSFTSCSATEQPPKKNEEGRESGGTGRAPSTVI
jgi:hypothetical protein